MVDIRWKQRFQNFSRAYGLLRSATDNSVYTHLSDLEKEGVIQRFEYTYELAWKTMKDYLENSGVTIESGAPRQVIKEAFAAGLIEDGQVWIDMMLHRNLVAHSYDLAKFNEVLEALTSRYLAALEKLHDHLKTRIDL